jgi:hypothetical protein
MRRSTMVQHLLSVHNVEDGRPAPMTDEEIAQSVKQIMALQQEMKSPR